MENEPTNEEKKELIKDIVENEQSKTDSATKDDKQNLAQKVVTKTKKTARKIADEATSLGPLVDLLNIF